MIKKISSKIIYENNWIKLHEDKVKFPDGAEGIYAYSEKKGSGPMIIPMNEKGMVGIIHEWRYPVKRDTWCFPIGGRDEGETLEDAAKRELMEETGIKAKEWKLIGRFNIDAGANSQETPVYLVKDLDFTDHEGHINELIHETKFLHLVEIDDMIREGLIRNAWLFAGLAILRAHLK